MVASHPRPFALVAALVGGLATWGINAAHAGTYALRAALLMPPLFLAGVWALLFGWPMREEDGRTPDWWLLGFGACVVCGVVIGIVLLAIH